jgi:hypothetical protein
VNIPLPLSQVDASHSTRRIGGSRRRWRPQCCGALTELGLVYDVQQFPSFQAYSFAVLTCQGAQLSQSSQHAEEERVSDEPDLSRGRIVPFPRHPPSCPILLSILNYKEHEFIFISKFITI